MQVLPGALSSDGWWYWDGAGWLPAVSPDGSWRWSGHQWVPFASHRHSTTWSWDPPWRPRDTAAIICWLTAVPAALAAGVVAAWLVFTLTAIAVLLASLAAFGLWAFIGGLMVRAKGRRREIFAIGGLLTFLVCIVYIVTLFSQPDPTNQNDHAAGIGTILLIAVTLPLSTLLAAFGKLIGRALGSMRKPH